MEKAIVSIFNADAAAQIVTLPEGKWAICVNKTTAGTEVLGVAEGSVQVEPTSAMILVEADADAEVTEKPVETEEKGFFARIWEAIVNFFAKLFGKKN
jgi:hypothetical protein